MGGGGQGARNHCTKALVIKSVTMGGGGLKNCLNLRDVIYEQPLMYR